MHNQKVLIQEILCLEHFRALVTLNRPFTHMDKLALIKGGLVHKTRATDITEVTLDAFMSQEVFLERCLDGELNATDVADLAEPVAVVLVGLQSEVVVEQLATLPTLLGSLPRVQPANMLPQVTFNLKFFPAKLAAKDTLLFHLSLNGFRRKLCSHLSFS